MLITNKEGKPKENDVIFFRLSSGEEVVAKLVGIRTDDVTVSKPLIVQLQQDPATGNIGLGFVPFCYSSDADQFTLDLKSMLVKPTNAVVKTVKENYTKATSNIIQPTTTGLIT